MNEKRNGGIDLMATTTTAQTPDQFQMPTLRHYPHNIKNTTVINIDY